MAKNTASEIDRMVVTRIFDAPRELVWKAWTDPKYVMQFARWIFALGENLSSA
jgi:uncharacterized protein YndB with AHSA1/START domain